MSRREVLGGLGATGLVAPALAASMADLPIPGDTLKFRVVRSGTEIGQHVLTFTRTGDDLLVRVEVELVVRLGFIPLYRYRHQNAERWQKGVLVGWDSTSNDNGDKAFSRASLDGSGLLQVEGSKSGKYTAPAGALCATHWNIAETKTPIVNPQNGELMKATIGGGQQQDGKLASGKPISGLRYTLVAPPDADLTLWYGADHHHWIGLDAVGSDKSLISYERV